MVTTELPGIDADAIDISVTGKTLVLKGSREPLEVKEGNSYHRRERWYGQFTKTIELPFAVEAKSRGEILQRHFDDQAAQGGIREAEKNYRQICVEEVPMADKSKDIQKQETEKENGLNGPGGEDIQP